MRLFWVDGVGLEFDGNRNCVGDVAEAWLNYRLISDCLS